MYRKFNIDCLRTLHGVFHSELELQDKIEQLLKNNAADYIREFILTKKDRPDFYIENGIVIEVKVDGSIGLVTAQLRRYAAEDRVKEIILVTTKSRHKPCLPEFINGKKLTVRIVYGGL